MSSTKPPVDVRSELVPVPGGLFDMGTDKGSEFERPVRSVSVAPFWVQATPVTNAQFAAFVDATDYRTSAEDQGEALIYVDGGYQMSKNACWRSFATKERMDHPVVLVSWIDATKYAEWRGMELIAEAQWEYLAKGTTARVFPWGDAPPDGSQCNFARAPQAIPATTPVLSFEPNQYGVFDLVGNVWQWCRDVFAPYESTVNVPESVRPANGATRVRRGGGWNVIQPFRLRCTNRGAMRPDDSATNLGFRCVWTPGECDPGDLR